jgi:hypothetical protein
LLARNEDAADGEPLLLLNVLLRLELVLSVFSMCELELVFMGRVVEDFGGDTLPPFKLFVEMLNVCEDFIDGFFFSSILGFVCGAHLRM